jgi:DDE superfamily endonuclease
VLLINALVQILFLSQTCGGSRHDKRVVDETPYPLPEGSELLQDLGFLGFTLDGVNVQTPIRKPRGGELTQEQKAANQALASRRVPIEHVNSSVKRLRILKEPCRLFKAGVRDMVMEIGCALHNFRARITPTWQALKSVSANTKSE